jgi:hypothetical protein
MIKKQRKIIMLKTTLGCWFPPTISGVEREFSPADHNGDLRAKFKYHLIVELRGCRHFWMFAGFAFPLVKTLLKCFNKQGKA